MEDITAPIKNERGSHFSNPHIWGKEDANSMISNALVMLKCGGDQPTGDGRSRRDFDSLIGSISSDEPILEGSYPCG
jgi:hypothetical protein